MTKAKKPKTAFGKLWQKAITKGKPDGPRLLVWDADILIYQAVLEALVETRVQDDQWTYTVDLARVKLTLWDRINQAGVELWATDHVFALSSLNNWRKAVLPTYKQNRTGKKPLGWWRVAAWLKENWKTIQVPALEADDVCGIIHTAPGLVSFGRGIPCVDVAGMETVVISEDKDFATLPGLWLNPRHPDGGPVAITLQQANRNHAVQTLTGDATDHYKGCPGIGPVRAKALLPEADRGLTDKKFREALWSVIVEQYAKQSLTAEDALAQADVAWIMRYHNWDAKKREVVLWQPGV